MNIELKPFYNTTHRNTVQITEMAHHSDMHLTPFVFFKSMLLQLDYDYRVKRGLLN